MATLTGLFLLAALAGSPSQAAPAAPPEVRIRAVAVDGSGRPVRDLAAADFRLEEDGKPRPLDGVVLEGGADVPSRRVFGILLDEFHVGAGAESEAVRSVLGRFVSDGVRPGDLVAVVKPLDPLTPIRFTTNRAAARRAVDTFAGRRGDYEPRTTFEAQLIGRAPATAEAARGRIVATALAQMAEQIAAVPDAHGAILLVSDGFASTTPRGRPGPGVSGMVRAASHFRVPIYTFVPSVSEDGTGAETPAATMLAALAERTGGVSVAGAASLAAGLEQAARDLDATYLLSWRPAQPGDGSFHAVRVEITRSHVTLRTPSGYYAPLHGRDGGVESAAPVLPFVYRRSRPIRQSPLVDVWVGMARGPGGRPMVTLTWEPGRSRYNLRTGTAPAMATLKATTPDGDVLFNGPLAPASASDAGAPPRAVFAAPPGRIELDLALGDAAGARVDTDSRDLDVPDLSGARTVLLPAAVIRTSTAPGFRAALADPHAAPSPGRVFSRLERLLVRVPAYGPGGAPVPVTATLLNPLGQPMRGVPPMPERTPDGATQFDLSLAPFAPGEYTLLLSVSSPSGELQQRVAFRVKG